MRQTSADIDRLWGIIRASPTIESVLSRAGEIDLADGHLCAGCIAQTVWNHGTGRPPDHGIRDLDLIYYDPADLTESGEASAAARIAGLLADIPAAIDVKNEARVHLWYESRFGIPIAPYGSVAEAVDSFPTTATAVAIALRDGDSRIVAPFGLGDLLGLVVRPNKRQIDRPVYEAKVPRWRRLWPELTYLAWSDSD